MADNVINVRLQSAYKTAAVWSTSNPILKLGEVGYEIDTGGLFKIGNGTSTWNQLPYSNHRPLTNNDFDTANITDANVGNLVVTGAARFLNTIQGTAASAVNATSATSAAKLTTNAGGVATPVYFANGVPTVVNGTSAANWLMNSLTTGNSMNSTADYFISQYASGGTTNTTFHRRPISKLPQYATASISGHTLTLKNGSGEVVTNLTLPNDNTDTKVTQTATTAKTYLIGNAGSATTTSGCNLSTAVYMNNGNLVVGGSITIGGNNADTSGAKWQYDSTLESASLVFA